MLLATSLVAPSIDLFHDSGAGAHRKIFRCHKCRATKRAEINEDRMQDTLKYLQMVFDIKDDKSGACKKYKELAADVAKKSEYSYLNLEQVFSIFNK